MVYCCSISLSPGISSPITIVHAQEATSSSSSPRERQILWVDVKDIISSATADHISSAISRASDSREEVDDKSSSSNFSAVIIALDTPGGSVDATFKIIESIQSSKVPVIGYVYPQGKSAWSAGTIILLATDYAAMAPFTTIGSAQPVAGGIPVNDTKIVNAITEKIVTLAQLHNRNVTQATRFVTHNDNLTPEAAMKNHVIEAIARDPEELLQKANNSTVMTLAGPKLLDTPFSNSHIVVHEPSLRVSLVDILSNPLLSTTLFTIGFFALIYGLTSPGFGSEIAGAAMIILALIGQGFDINWAAFALLAIGAGLIAYELYSPGFGAMGIGGIVLLVVGSTLMITQPVRPLLISEHRMSELVLISATITAPLGVFFALITYKAWRAKTQAPLPFVLQSQTGVTVEAISSTKPGFVIVGGEYWRARTEEGSGIEIGKGQNVRVVRKDSDLLIIEPFKEEKEEKEKREGKDP
ncbi:NfeD family protein [Candidatus Nitrososphaera evergladensis]|uniref:NfeD family protein n=1 Tax=Candidatus Nitrososphaera evergladensis TaxID=1459637 RepID=UPI00130E8A52|nr:nodulation protein NfeD [Candidatus Nitrososphaera evergladensis]